MSTGFSESRRLYFRLLRYVRPYWRMFSASLLCMMLTAATEPALPALMKPLLDGSFVKKDQLLITFIPVLIIVLFIFRGLVTFAASYTTAWVGNKVVMDLRAAMFDRLLQIPTQTMDDSSSGNMVANIAFNVTQVMNSATNVLTVLVRDSLTIAGLLAWLFWLNWKLSLITLVMAPPVMLLMRVVSVRLRKMSRALQANLGDISHVLEESIACHKVVKIYGGQNYERERFGSSIQRARRFAMKVTVASQSYSPVVQLIAAIAVAVVIYVATHQSANNETTVGGFVSYMIAMLMLLSPVKRLTGLNEALQRGLAAAEVVFSRLDDASEEDTGTLALPRASGELGFENVSLTYPGKIFPALDGVTLHIRPGEHVALVGASGSGKSSLVNLIPRFYTPSEGRVLIDGQDIRDIRLADLRANIALVSQEVMLFNDSIAANIAYGEKAGASETEITTAAESAHAWEYIRELPEGLNTLVGERGVKLSGGQRQRLAIARAILKDAPILILDEATSALDTESERYVQAALEELMRGRTTLVIAHRLSTVEKADRIVVLDRGGIVEIGTHAELLAKGGYYANLYRLQFSGSPMEPA
jgi:ATP-binding cassette, subfamily B, bacterial MsbA